MRWTPYLFILGLLGALAVSLRDNRQADRWVADRDSTLAAVDSAATLRGLRERDSLQQLIAEQSKAVARLQGVSGRLVGVGARLREASDSLGRLLPTLQNASDSLQNASGRIERLEAGYDSLKLGVDTLLVAVDTLHSTIRALVLDTLAIHVSDSAGWASVDSLRALVGRVPRPKKWVPVVTVGYGAVLTGGVVRMGPSVSVGLRVPF